jgi:phosphoribosyl-ATP pyrophosphohydrolase
MLNELYNIIKDRKTNPREGSYTNKLLEQGYHRIAQKVGEESVEVIIAAGIHGRLRVIEESADLLYHLFVLLVNQEIDLREVEEELERRHKGTE